MPWVELFQPLASERQSAEVILYCVKQGFCIGISDYWILWRVKFHHVVTAIDIFINIAFSSATKSFNCILFSFFHFRSITILNYWNTFTCVNPVASNTVTTEVPNAFNWVCFVSDLNFIRLHSFLNLFTNVSQAHINTCRSYSSVSCILYRCQ